MMKIRGLRKGFALGMALMMLLVSTAGTVFAEEETAAPETAAAESTAAETAAAETAAAETAADETAVVETSTVTLNSGETLELDGSILTINEDGTQLLSDGSGDIKLVINGEIMTLSEAAGLGYVYALTIEADGGDKVEAEVGEGITASAGDDPCGARAIDIEATSGSEVNVTVDGPAGAYSLDWESDGVNIRATDGSKVSVTAEGDISAVDQGNGGGRAVIIAAKGEDTVVTVNADGDITAGSGKDETYGTYIYADDATVAVQNTGDIKSTGTAVQMAVYGENAMTFVAADGDISGDKRAAEVRVHGENNTAVIAADGKAVSGADGPAVVISDSGTDSFVDVLVNQGVESAGEGVQILAGGSGENSKVIFQTESIDAKGVGLEIGTKGEEGKTSVHVDKDIDANAQYYAAGINIDSNGENKQMEIDVDGIVFAASDEGSAVGVHVNGAPEGADENQLDLDLSIGKDVLVVTIDAAEEQDVTGVQVDATGVEASEMNADIDVGADILVMTEQGQAKGVALITDMNTTAESELSVTVDRNISAFSNQGDAAGVVISEKQSGAGASEIAVEAGERIIASTTEGRAYGADINLNLTDDASTAVDVEAGKGIRVDTKTGEAKGVTLTAVLNESAEAEVNLQAKDEISAKTESGSARGLDIYLFSESDQKAVIDVQVDGEVNVEAGNGDATGADIRSNTSGEDAAAEVSVKISDKITAESEDMIATGVKVLSNGDVKTDIQTADIEAHGAALSSGLEVVNYGGDVDAEVNGTIEVTSSEGKSSDGVFIRDGLGGASGELGTVTVNVNGDISSDGQGISVRVYSVKEEWLDDVIPEMDDSELISTEYHKNMDHEVESLSTYYNEEDDYYYDSEGYVWRETDKSGEGSVKVTVTGDVTGGQTGLLLSGNTLAPVDIIVDGTLSGGESAVLVRDERITDNLTLTVWEVKPGESGNLVEKQVSNEDGTNGTEAMEEVEKEIQYIIRLRQPDEGGALSMSGTRDYEGYQVANEGDNIVMRLNLNEDYELIGAYGDAEQQVTLMQDADGHYYLIVPRGGGVELSVRLRRIVTYSSLTFDPNGGTFYGISHAYVVPVENGIKYALPEAPVKDGSRFLGWYASNIPASDENWKAPEEGDPMLKQAKEYVPVYQNRIYTAVWAEETAANP